jgi:hypothetical protein
MKNIKYGVLILIGFWCLFSNKAKAQSFYQKMDDVSAKTEIKILENQIKENIKLIEILRESKKTDSLLDKNSVRNSALKQSLISDKQESNIRMQNKLFLIQKASKAY